MADTFPYRNKHTERVQYLTEEQALVFADQYDRLPSDFEELQAKADEAAAVAASLAGSEAPKKEQKAAQTEAEAAAQAVADAGTPVTPDAGETKGA